MNLMTLKHIPQQSGMCFRFLICGLLLWSAPALQMAAEKTAEPPVEAIDSVIGLLTDSLADGMEAGMEPRFSSLTEEDYRQVAEELGVEVAAIKAVVDIEAGPQHKGFWQPGKPLINFDLSMYRKFAPRRNVSLSKARKRAPEIFNRPNAKKYGSYQAAQHARLVGKHILGHVPDRRLQLAQMRSRKHQRVCGNDEPLRARPARTVCPFHQKLRHGQRYQKTQMAPVRSKIQWPKSPLTRLPQTPGRRL